MWVSSDGEDTVVRSQSMGSIEQLSCVRRKRETVSMTGIASLEYMMMLMFTASPKLMDEKGTVVPKFRSESHE